MMGTMTSGVEYSLNLTMSLGAMVEVSKTALGDRTWSGMLSVGGRF